VRGRFTGVVSLSAPLEAAEAGEREGRESDEGPGKWGHAAEGEGGGGGMEGVGLT